jgi:hypothetical protein
MIAICDHNTAGNARATQEAAAGALAVLAGMEITTAEEVHVLGLFPDQEQALYLTAVAVGLFMGAMTLLAMVFAPQRPQTVSGPVAPPATGGSSA